MGLGLGAGVGAGVEVRIRVKGLRQTSTLSTEGSKGYVRRAPPWMVSVEARASADGLSS